MSRQDEFDREARLLQAAGHLADLALLSCGADAGIALIGAALKAWERQHGNAAAFDLAGLALSAVRMPDPHPHGLS